VSFTPIILEQAVEQALREALTVNLEALGVEGYQIATFWANEAEIFRTFPSIEISAGTFGRSNGPNGKQRDAKIGIRLATSEPADPTRRVLGQLLKAVEDIPRTLGLPSPFSTYSLNVWREETGGVGFDEDAQEVDFDLTIKTCGV